MECFSNSRRLYASLFHGVVLLTAASVSVVGPFSPLALAEAPHDARITAATAVGPEFNLDDFAPEAGPRQPMSFDAAPAAQQPAAIASQRGAKEPGIVDVRPVSSSSSGWAAAGADDDQQVRITAELADHHIRRGFDLGCRGALFSARSEFIQALRMLSLAHDAAEGGNVHADSLGAGMRALEEAKDFIPSGTRLEANIDLEAIVAAHQTAALKSTPAGGIRSMSTQMALASYANFARGHLSHAAGRLPAGSMALYGLGKVYAALGDAQSDDRQLNEYRAMTLFQASLESDLNNPLAANELGVLMARYGQYEAARDLLQRSVALQPQPAVWHNLAIVHQRLGQLAEARQAGQQSQISEQPADLGSPYAGLAAGGVNLVDQQSFGRTRSPSARDQAAAAAAAQASEVVAPMAEPPDVMTPKMPIPYIVTPRASSATPQSRFRVAQ